MSVLFHFDICGIIFGARRETLYKTKEGQTIMYLKCVNYSPVSHSTNSRQAPNEVLPPGITLAEVTNTTKPLISSIDS